MRIALARLLLSPAGRTASSNGGGGLLLLDEPTNHLDSAAIRWLGQFLKNSTGTFVIVSHDEQLLEDACDHICEVRGRCASVRSKSLRNVIRVKCLFMDQR